MWEAERGAARHDKISMITTCIVCVKLCDFPGENGGIQRDATMLKYIYISMWKRYGGFLTHVFSKKYGLPV